MKSFAELFGDGSGLAGTDLTAVAFDDGDNLGRCAGEKAFIGCVHIQTR